MAVCHRREPAAISTFSANARPVRPDHRGPALERKKRVKNARKKKRAKNALAVIGVKKNA